MTKKKMTTSLATYITTLILSLIGHMERKIALFLIKKKALMSYSRHCVYGSHGKKSIGLWS